jgi:hypothetical protein
MKLSEAILCLDCESIYDGTGPSPEYRRNACPHCGSKAGWRLSLWIPTRQAVIEPQGFRRAGGERAVP